MKKIVLTFGLIAGAVLSAMLLLTLSFQDAIGFDRGAVVGYTTMVLAFLLIFFGVRTYRDDVAGGAVSFGRAFAVGMLIAAVASVCYAATWELARARLAPDFAERYQAHLLEQARADGADEVELARKREELARYAALYRNPAISLAVTFMEPMPVALVVALVSAGVLRRRSGEAREGRGDGKGAGRVVVA